MTASERAERVLLGACLLEDQETIDLLCSSVLPEHFSLDAHQRIAKRIQELHASGQPVNQATVPQELSRHKELQAVGGISYVIGLTEGMPLQLRQTALDHIARLKEFWRLRQVAALAEDLTAKVQEEESHTLIQAAAARLEAIASESGEEDNDAGSLTVRAMEQWEQEREQEDAFGLSFGIPDLDAHTGGMKAGQQTALGAGSGVGKTTLLAQVLWANRGIPCHAFLLEPTREEVLRKLWSIESGVRYSAAVNPKLANESERRALREAAYRVGEWPLRLNDQASLTLDRVLSLGRLSIHRYGTRLIALDYIQRLKVKANEPGEQMRLRVARASMALADLVKGTKCHSLLLSQLTTGRKNGAQAKPTMYDFRESSQIENDAHTIILLHRNYDEEQGYYSDQGAILVPKVRFGTPCNLQAQFDSQMAIWKGAN